MEPTPAESDTPKKTREELPPDLRGELGLHTASYTDAADDISVIALRIVASIPVTERVFVDARLPLALAFDRTTYGTLGNLMLGAHATTSLGKTTWLSYGGAFGVPLLSGQGQREAGYAAAQIPSAFWNLHEYSPSNIPFEVRLGLEHLMDPFTFRAEIAPVVMAPIGRNEQVEVVVLHAAEAQIGNTLGAGVRLQGVALPTSKELEYSSLSLSSAYQAAIEPFVVVQKPQYFFRTGFMLPLSNPLGHSTFGLKTYGVHLAMGIHLD